MFKVRTISFGGFSLLKGTLESFAQAGSAEAVRIGEELAAANLSEGRFEFIGSFAPTTSNSANALKIESDSMILILFTTKVRLTSKQSYPSRSTRFFKKKE